MKKYIAMIAALLTISAGIPAYAETVEDPRYATSVAEEVYELDPADGQPERNEEAHTTSAPSYAAEESDLDPDPFTPRIFRHGEQGRGEIEDIISYWEENGYPDNLSFIAETGGEMIDDVIYTSYDVGLVSDTEENRGEILDIAGSSNVLRFTTGNTSLWERSMHFEKLCYIAAMEEDIGILEVRFYKNSDMIEVVVSGSETTYYERFGKQFGSVAVFTNERNVTTAVDNSGFDPGDSGNKVTDYTEKTSNAEIFHADLFLAAYPNGWISGSPVELGEDLNTATIGIGGNGVDIGSSSLLEGTLGITAESSAKKSVSVWLFAVGAAAVVLLAVIAVMLRRRVKIGADGTAAAHGGAKSQIIAAIKNAEEQPDPRLLEKIRDNITK